MPDLEEQLARQAEVLEALPAEEEEEEEAAVEAEVVEAIPEALECVPAVRMSEAEFTELAAQLLPDPVQPWHETHAVGGPVPAAPVEE
jgi:hypothetical protein